MLTLAATLIRNGEAIDVATREVEMISDNHENYWTEYEYFDAEDRAVALLQADLSDRHPEIEDMTELFEFAEWPFI